MNKLNTVQERADIPPHTLFFIGCSLALCVQHFPRKNAFDLKRQMDSLVEPAPLIPDMKILGGVRVVFAFFIFSVSLRSFLQER